MSLQNPPRIRDLVYEGWQCMSGFCKDRMKHLWSGYVRSSFNKYWMQSYFVSWSLLFCHILSEVERNVISHIIASDQIILISSRSVTPSAFYREQNMSGPTRRSLWFKIWQRERTGTQREAGWRQVKRGRNPL